MFQFSVFILLKFIKKVFFRLCIFSQGFITIVSKMHWWDRRRYFDFHEGPGGDLQSIDQ